MNDSYQVLNMLLRTEKGAIQSQDNKYFFNVRKNANKIQIKKAVEEIYKVKVSSVNTTLVPGKTKRVRYQAGKTPDWKKAIVTLKDGHKIDLA
jgi:large subunit ribosomal protein L23